MYGSSFVTYKLKFLTIITALISIFFKLIGSEDDLDNEMRALIYFMLSRHGSILAQKVNANITHKY